jgi:signal transduction histidine kinase
VFALWRHLPEALELPGLKAVNTRLREELGRRRRAEQDLEVAHRELRMVSSMVAHDLRTPIASALLMVEATAANAGSLSADRMKTQLGAVAGSLKTMTETLVTLSEQAHHESATPTKVDVNDLMGDVKAALSSTLAVAGGDLSWRDLPVLRVPRDRLFHLLLNLVENGIKHAGDQRPAITVSGRRDDHGPVIEVRDSGPGVPAGERGKIFQARYRAENGRPAEGSGMGLAFCKRMIEDLGGTIEADDNPGGGTIIRLRLPADLEVNPGISPGPGRVPPGSASDPSSDPAR